MHKKATLSRPLYSAGFSTLRPLTLGPLSGAAWVAVFGIALAAAAGPETDRSALSLTTGAGLQLLATAIFAGVTSFWPPPIFVLVVHSRRGIRGPGGTPSDLRRAPVHP